ncbi:D-alanyl-D-alanine carboxypeptidase family protein [Spirillospora sp. NPDC029432]|uniref:D-alanyl-D-alanine carboxypeptidase family protein n=1 Tax=Spirillospora sp. NPDC029432 TaxID=3154599 RepID=UPI003454CC5F
MPIPRSAVLTAVFLVMAVVLALPGGAAAREDPVKELRAAASKARSELKKATEKMEKRKKDLASSQDRLRDTLKDLAKAEADLHRIREPLARLANMSYQQPGAAGSMSIFGGGDAGEALRATADITHIANGQQTLVKQADELQRRRQRLASTAQDLQSRNAVEQTKLQQEIDALKKRSAELTAQLSGKLKKLEADRERRLLAKCDRSGAANAKNFPNGLIPDRYLCPLPQKGEQLRADAAIAFYKLNAAYKRRFGRDMCVTDSYRSLPDQQRVYAQRPGFAAVPGTSNHGKGQALDLCGGVENASTAQFNWLEANSKKYGWFHPAWAYSNPYEPWHWEFGSESES